nr:uncharacterized protein LOC129382271 isoform X5 [Dermacentor andersoni]
MFAIVASSFALAVYMVKLLKELVEPSDIFLQCLRSHLSVPSTEVRGRGPVSRRHRDHAICVGKGSTRGFDIRISSKCCLRKGFFCPKHPRCYEPRQSSQSVDSCMPQHQGKGLTSTRDPSVRHGMRKRRKKYTHHDWWILDILLIVIRIYARRWALVHAYRLLRGLGFESYGIRPGSAATWFHRRWPERVARGSYFSTLQRWGRTGIPYWTEAAIMLIAAEMTEIIFKIVVVVLNGR